MHTTSATLTHRELSTSGEVAFITFQVDETFSFAEGQFVMIHAKIGDQMIKKPYSIATSHSYMQDQKKIGFVIKYTRGGGMSDFLINTLQEDQQVTLQGPVGHYTDSRTHDNYLLISIGSGLSPNVGLCEHLIETQTYKRLVVLHGERHLTHLVPSLHQRRTEYGHENSNFLYLPVLSQEKHLSSEMRAGYIQDFLKEAVQFVGTQTSCFVCGKPEMVNDVRKKLETLGIETQDITFEKY